MTVPIDPGLLSNAANAQRIMRSLELFDQLERERLHMEPMVTITQAEYDHLHARIDALEQKLRQVVNDHLDCGSLEHRATMAEHKLRNVQNVLLRHASERNQDALRRLGE